MTRVIPQIVNTKTALRAAAYIPLLWDKLL